MKGIKGIKKTLAIGIIALFIGLATAPMMSGNSIIRVEKTTVQKNITPIELTIYQPNGAVTTEIQELTAEDIQTLEQLYITLNSATNKAEAQNILKAFIENIGKTKGALGCYIGKGLIPGRNIFSIGIGGIIRTRLYDIKITPLKLFRMWRYTDLGVTLITNGIIPTKFLWGRQIGCMAGFFGIHIYIPAEFGFQGRKSFSLFVGHTALASGFSF